MNTINRFSLKAFFERRPGLFLELLYSIFVTFNGATLRLLVAQSQCAKNAPNVHFFMIGRILDKENSSGLSYEELTEEPACAVARIGYPLLEHTNLQLQDINTCPWILPQRGSVLRHRFDMMFRRAGLEPPVNVVDTTALLLITALLQETDSRHVMPQDVARYYASLNVLSILPIELPCKMDAFGIIRQSEHLLSPGADLLLRAVRDMAKELY